MGNLVHSRRFACMSFKFYIEEYTRMNVEKNYMREIEFGLSQLHLRYLASSMIHTIERVPHGLVDVL